MPSRRDRDALSLTLEAPEVPAPSLAALLGPNARVEHRLRRGLFEKRIACLDGQRYLLYRFARRAYARRLTWLLHEARSRRLRLQHFVSSSAGWLDVPAHPGHWVVAGYLDGTPLTGWGDTTSLAALGRLLAGLHGIEGPRAGALFRRNITWGSYAGRLRRELLHTLDTPSARHDKRQWLRQASAFLDDLPMFQLSHGDLYGRNVLIGSDGVGLIDYELARFEPAGIELATSLLRAFCGQREDLRAALLDAYLDAAPVHLAALWQEHAPFYLAAAALRLSAQRSFRARRLARLGQSGEAAWQRAHRYADWANSLVEAAMGGVRPAGELLRKCV